MLSSREFDKLLERLVVVPVAGISPADKLIHMRQILSAMEVRRDADDSAAIAPGLDIVPPQSGRRPLDEVLTPGRGASDRVLVLRADAGDSEAWLLFHLRHIHAVRCAGRELSVQMSAWVVPPTGGKLTPIPDCQAVRVEPRRICSDAYPRAALASARWDEAQSPLIAAFPASLLSGPAGPLSADRDGLADPSPQRVRVELQLCIDDVPQGFDTVDLEVYDAARLGSLYARLRDRLLDIDVASQAEGSAPFQAVDHPLYPGLRILADAAAEELQSIVAGHELHRPGASDPAWSLRVGSHLELLTFLGLSEAARPDHPGLLDAGGGAACDRSAGFARLRADLDGDAWCEVWAQRELGRPAGDAAPSIEPELAIRRKQRATSSLFEAHLGALRAALAIAGPELDGSPEDWHRRLRALERAVLRSSRALFPETTALTAERRQRILWHASTRTAADRAGLLDGVFPSLCRELRRGLNDAAAWARARGLVQYAGAERIPAGASLIEALLHGDDALFAELQRRDGADPLEPAPLAGLSTLPRDGASPRLRRAPGALCPPPPDEAPGRVEAHTDRGAHARMPVVARMPVRGATPR